MAYNSCTNISTPSKLTRSNLLGASKSNNLKNWTPPRIGWIRYNTDISKSTFNPVTAISNVSRDSTGHIVKKDGRAIKKSSCY